MARTRAPLKRAAVMLGAAVAVAVLVALFLRAPEWRGATTARPVETSGATARQTRPPTRRLARLELSGRQEFEGSARPACTLHERSGLQVALRTGIAALPVVALQVDRFDGAGRYTGRVYVTARGARGLVRSTGDARIELEERRIDDGRRLLAGSLAGSYAGPAGSGKVRARFDHCAYRAERPSATAP